MRDRTGSGLGLGISFILALCPILCEHSPPGLAFYLVFQTRATPRSARSVDLIGLATTVGTYARDRTEVYLGYAAPPILIDDPSPLKGIPPDV
jgi:hypothetical protein